MRFPRKGREHLFSTVVLFGLAAMVWGDDSPPLLQPPQGETFVHDPSTIQREGGHYFLAGTGRGIRTMSSPDLVTWSQGKPVFDSPPAWALESIPRFRGHIWAPDILHLNGRYYLYYSVSSFGRQTSAIGLTTSPTLDPTSPDYQWTDHGPVIHSDENSPFNAIDPGLFQDRDGRLWMSFGSFWKGLYLFELNPKTGLRLDQNSPMHRLAWNEEIEAPCLTWHNDYYYLFVNWGKCCRGTNSTYEVRVGRSRKVTGPYVDHKGVNLVDGGGKPFLQTSGRFIGPGHIAVFPKEDQDYFSYHYYDRESRGRSRLGLGRLDWSDDDWPLAVTVSETETLFVARPLTDDNLFTPGIEGPACDRDGNIYAVNFAKEHTIGKVSPEGKAELFVELPEGSTGNGIVFDPNGMMFVADYTGHNVLRIDPQTRAISVYAHEPTMNQPNDLARAPNGNLYASDPNWQEGTGQVWLIDRQGKVQLVAPDMGTSNGLDVSPDGQTLYVNESQQQNVWAFTIESDGTLSQKRLLKKFETHGFDGMRCDVDGNLYITRHGKGTVVKMSPDGRVLREVDVLGTKPSNLCFGGPDGRTVYVTEVDHQRLVSFRVDRPGLAWTRWNDRR